MKRFLLLVPAAAAAITLAGCGSSTSSSTGTGSHTMSGHAGARSTASAAAMHNAADVIFAQGMIPHHEQAIEMAELAATRAANGNVKTLAARIRAAQDPEIRTMTGWLKSWRQPTGMPGMTMTGGMGGMSAGDMAKFRALSGSTFDRAFLRMMTAHHQGAIRMARSEQKTGRHPAAVKLAGRIIAGQSAEVRTMATLLKQ